MRPKSLIALMLCAILAPAAELPVRTVVLYKHGVGYFQRAGTLGPGESARLDFKAGEMNDVLKSLTINDRAAKSPACATTPAFRSIRSSPNFPSGSTMAQPLSAVIDQLKGARIEMEFGAQKVAGAIVSARLIAGDKDHPEREQLTLLHGFRRTPQRGSRGRDFNPLPRREAATAVQGLSRRSDRRPVAG